MNLAFFKPNKLNYSETFVDAHIRLLPDPKFVLYGGFFPLYKPDGSLLIESKTGLISYFIQKRLFKKKHIAVRTKALVNYLRVNNIDVAFAEYGPTGALIADACSILNIPLIVNFHGFDIHHQPTVAEYLTLYKKMFKTAYAVIGVSRYMVSELIKIGLDPAKAVFNSCGVETSFFLSAPVLSSGPIFLSVARFAEKKGPLQVIQAFKLVLAQVPEARLIMAGTGPLLEQSKKMTAELGIESLVDFKGVMTQQGILGLMAISRAFVQHSRTAPSGDMEGTPVSVLEASSAGLPVISTRHAGIIDAVLENITGFLVDEMDVIKMSEHMITLAKDPVLAAKLGSKGREHMINNYEMSARIATITDLLHSSIEKFNFIKKTEA